VQSHIPGVGLNIAWKYLSQEQKDSFKAQAREILRCVRTLRSPLSVPWHVNPDPDPVSHRGIQQLERELLFDGEDSDRGPIHNDIQSSNIIVDKDRIVAAVDWEMAGYFGWIRAAEVHVQIRSPNRETYANLYLDPKFLDDILFWSDLYETDHD